MRRHVLVPLSGSRQARVSDRADGGHDLGLDLLGQRRVADLLEAGLGVVRGEVPRKALTALPFVGVLAYLLQTIS